MELSAPRQLPTRYHVLQICAAVVLCGSLLAVGAVHVSTALVVAIVSGVLGCLATTLAPVPRGARVLSYATAALALFCVLQALPLPRSVVGLISPSSLAIWDGSLRPLNEPLRAWVPLSLNPGATWVEAAKWGGYAGIVAATALLSKRRGALGKIMLTVLVCGLLCAGIALVHRVLGATRLYGIYEPKLAVTPWRVAPLLNPNNFAGYLNFSALIGLGLLLGRRPPLPRAFLGLASVFILAVSISTGSRGAVASLLFGLMLLVFRLQQLQRPDSPPRFDRLLRVAPLAAVLLGAVVLVWLGGSRTVLSALSQTDFDKLSINLWTLPLVLDFPGFGVGRGAFETVFPAYRRGGGELLFQFPENIVSQWLSEWGLIVGLLGLAAFCWCLRPRVLSLSGDIRRHAAHIAILTLVLHNLVDLSLEISSVSTAAFAILGTLAGGSDRRESSESYALAPDRRFALAYAGAMLVVVAAASAIGSRSALRDRLELRDVYASSDMKDAGTAAAFLERVVDAIRRHPGDAYFPLLAALVTNHAGGNALPWLGLAIERDPERGVPHYWLATLLFQRGLTEQAVLHVRMAVSRDPSLRDEAAGPLLQHVKDMPQLMRAIPEGQTGQAFLVTLAGRLKRNPKEGLTQDAVLHAAIQRDPNAARPRLLQGNILADALERPSDDSRCLEAARDVCMKLLRQGLEILHSSHEFPIEAALLQARYLKLTNRPAEADDLLVRRCAELDAPHNCWRERVHAALATGDAGRADRAMADYLSVVCSAGDNCAKAAITLGDLAAKRADWARAVKYYSRAVRENPTQGNANRLSRAMRQAKKLQLPGETPSDVTAPGPE